jgi:hypothetical protein
MDTRWTALALLVPLTALDALVPVPFAAIFLLYVVLARPAWVVRMLGRVYGHR